MARKVAVPQEVSPWLCDEGDKPPALMRSPAQTLASVIAAHALCRGERVALRYLDRGERESDADTYASLAVAARNIAGGLRDAGLTGRPVILLLPQGLDYVRAFLGCLFAGAIAVPVPSIADRRALARTRGIVAHVRPAALICPAPLAASADVADMAALAPPGVRVLAVEELKQNPPLDRLHVRAPDDPAFIQYTSGATSAPKGVVITEANLAANLATIADAMRQSAEHSAVSWLPLHHDMGLIGNALTPLFLGAETTLMSPLAFLQKPLRWLAAMDRYGATTSGAPNFAYDMVVRAVPFEAVAQLDLSRWTMAYCGAEPVRPETLARFSTHLAPAGFRPGALYPCYGLAEATLMVTGGMAGAGVQVRNLSARAFSGAGADRPSVACGRPHGATRVVLLASDGAPGEMGEICVAGPGVSPGFWDPDAGMAVPDPERRVDVDGAAYLRTGDLGRWVDGALHVVGRLKNMIILSGANHYAEDIEATVRTMEDAGGLLEAAVFAAPGAEEGFSIICERAGGPDGVEALKVAISRTVAEAHGLLPTDILIVPPGAIARTPSGKLMREETRRQFQHLLVREDVRP